MTPPDPPPSNPYDPTWPQPEQPYGQQPPAQPYGQPPVEPPPGQPGDTAPYAPYGQQQPYGQPAYGQAPPGTASYGGAVTTQHPSATTAMVLGIGALAGMFVCGLPIVLAPFAWMIGGRTVKEIDANPGRFTGREQAQAGRIMGIIGTVLLVLGVIAMIGLLGLLFASSGEVTGTTLSSTVGPNA